MRDEVELISDGEGVAVIGDAAVVDRFLAFAGVPSRDLQLHQKLGSALVASSGAAQAGSQLATSSGRWVKLTEESAAALKFGRAMKGSSDGINRAIVTTDKGKAAKILEFANPGTFGSILTNPAMLAGAAGIMAQLAMQQTMEEITEYLKGIDEKVDDILRAHKDAAIAEMIGVGMVIDDAMLKRQHVGRVSEVTWSSLHGAAQSIATTQAYALRQLDALVEKLEKKTRVGELDSLADTAKVAVVEWLAVLARCSQLQDGLAVLELDRVLDSTPEDADKHRTAIRAARARRRDVISVSTARLLSRLGTAAVGANQQVLLHPWKAGRVVRSFDKAAGDVLVFHDMLEIEIEGSHSASEAKPWREAVGEARADAVEVTERSARAVARFGVKTLADTRAGTGRVAGGAAERLPWRRSENARTKDVYNNSEPADPEE